ncbi:hypothetical protein ASG87_06805 [Frateuria sp. Soil773]|uniref:hypothetical protein n=1 Tax=Frateuria sp. Soil773 TaxID=1736407 RepID=UPI000701EF68|nr:hypothetical protein [Frateuria sp. Soil773]KRE88321.1 hypothetical protein ASG87_06805 [Frateuria sp. Soil773]
MSFLRTTGSIGTTLLGALLLAGVAHATEVSMAGGSVTFSTPDNWLGIMETQGDPEVRVFQVPDPSPTASNSLARVTVTVKQVADVNDFQQYAGSASAKAQQLAGYRPVQAVSNTAGPNSYAYTARENDVEFSYSESYWFKGNHAVQLRCVRPAQSQAGPAWSAAFDQGCAAIAARLK